MKLKEYRVICKLRLFNEDILIDVRSYAYNYKQAVNSVQLYIKKINLHLTITSVWLKKENQKYQFKRAVVNNVFVDL